MNTVRSKREEKKGCSINIKNRKEVEENEIKENKKFGLMVVQYSVINGSAI